MLDIDVSSITYNKINDFYKDNPDIAALIGASNNPFKFHIYVKLNYWVNESDYTSEVHKWYEKIYHEACDRCDIMNLDEASDDFRHCFFRMLSK